MSSSASNKLTSRRQGSMEVLGWVLQSYATWWNCTEEQSSRRVRERDREQPFPWFFRSWRSAWRLEKNASIGESEAGDRLTTPRRLKVSECSSLKMSSIRVRLLRRC